MSSDYETLLRRNAADAGVEAHFATGNACSVAAGRLSYFLDWHGPALAIDTACSSSLVAVHMACRSLLSGECDLALTAGVNLLLDDTRFEAYERAGMLSPTGHCKTFDAAADGYVRGEGCAAVLLKRLSDAQADGDRILGVIRGSAINQDGSSTGLTAPNQLAQQEVIEAALTQAGVAPHEVSYLEAHGTGTKLGDPIEVMAAAKVLGQGRPNHMPLWIGSVKSIIGHLEAAAGIAGLLKTVLAMHYGRLPAQRHYKNPNLHIPWERLPVRVVAQAQPWPAGSKVAGLSSFGFSGTNAHVVVEEYVALQRAQTPSHGPVLVVLSARNEGRLKAQAKQLLGYLARHEENLAELAYTLQVGRDAMGVRLALVVHTLEAFKDKLATYVASDCTHAVGYFGQVKSEKPALKLLVDDEIVTQIGQDRVIQDKLDERAKRWVQGLPVDWVQLYGEVKPGRISLPTYPFAQERYWIPNTKPSTSMAALATTEPACFEERWTPRPLPAFAKGHAHTLVCVLSDPAHCELIKAALASQAPGTRVVFVLLGEAQRIQDNVTLSYRIPLQADPETDAQVLRTLYEEQGAIDALLYLCALEQPSWISDIGPILRLLQAIERSGVVCQRILLAGQSGEAYEYAQLESWIGIERSLGTVLPQTRLSTVLEYSVIATPLAAWISRLYDELSDA